MSYHYVIIFLMADTSTSRKRPMSVSISDDDKALLGMVARVEARSRSEVVRRAVRSYADKEGIDMESIKWNPGEEVPGQGGGSDQGALGKALDASPDGLVADPATAAASTVETEAPAVAPKKGKGKANKAETTKTDFSQANVGDEEDKETY